MKLFSSRSLRKRENRLPLLLSFFIPFAVCCLAFTVGSLIATGKALYPVGDKLILAHDGWHQYYPFLLEYREKLVSGGSLQYTWQVGMGTGYASLFAYYLASPLNLLSVLVPSAYLTEFFAFLTILKISLAGLFFAVFLKKVYGNNDMTIPFFALLYAFCSWVCGYYWNLMWLDVFALLPLLVAATVCLLRDGKFAFYTCVLALTLWCNYYMAYFCCIFVLLSFMCFCITCWNGFGNFLRRFARIGICTLLAAGMTAVLLLPTLQAMQTTNSAKTREVSLLWLNIVEGAYGTTSEGQSILNLLQTQTLPGFLSASRQVLSNLLTDPEITKMSGLPNVFCGYSTVILAIYYFCCKKIKLREKICNLLLLLLLLCSFIFRILDYVWHGFHFPNMLPYRFSFLFSFVLISMAYRAFHLMDGFKKWHLLVILPVAAALFVNGLGMEHTGTLRTILCAMVLAGMIVFFLLYAPTKPRKTLATVLLCAIFTSEMLFCFGSGIGKVGYTSRDSYPKNGEQVQALLHYAEENTTELFYRTEVTATQTLNDGSFNGYHGVSIFTSSANVNFNRFSRALGFSSWPGSNRFSYYEGTPFTNTMSGIRFLLDRDGAQHDKDYTTLVATSDGVNLLECDSYISLGFMAKSSLGDFVRKDGSSDPIDEQEEMFRQATGIEGGLYTRLSYSGLECTADTTLNANLGSNSRFSFSTRDAAEKTEMRISYDIPKDGLYCATTGLSAASEVKVYVNGSYSFTRNIKARSLFTLGTLQRGDTVEFAYDVEVGKSGTLSLDVAMLNQKVFDAGWASLADEPWRLTEVSDTCLKGTVTALRDGLFYTAVPYEPGWTALVDGEEIPLADGYDPSNEDVALTDAVIAFPLSAGTHEIVLTYSTPGLPLGALITGVSLLVFVGLLYLCRKRGTLLPDVIKTKPVDAEPLWEECAPTHEADWADMTMPELLLEEEATSQEEPPELSQEISPEE